MNHKNKETTSSMFPANVVSIIFRLSTESLVWLDGTTRDDNGTQIANRRFFHDLLVRMQFSDESEEYGIPDTHFLRPRLLILLSLILFSEGHCCCMSVRCNILRSCCRYYGILDANG